MKNQYGRRPLFILLNVFFVFFPCYAYADRDTVNTSTHMHRHTPTHMHKYAHTHKHTHPHTWPMAYSVKFSMFECADCSSWRVRKRMSEKGGRQGGEGGEGGRGGTSHSLHCLEKSRGEERRGEEERRRGGEEERRSAGQEVPMEGQARRSTEHRVISYGGF